MSVHIINFSATETIIFLILLRRVSSMLLNMESPTIKMVPLDHVSEVLLSLSILLIELTSLAFLI